MTGIVSVIVLSAGLIADATGGRLAAGSPGTVFTGVSIDSRTTNAGALFVAIRGDRFDGHAFLAEAAARGAAGFLVSDPSAAADIDDRCVIVVPETIAGLQRLASEIRRRSGATIVAITGSAGKTSTKEIAADLLATRYRVFRNQGNLNNHIGLPLSLTELAHGPEVAVVEFGMNHAGEIRELVGIARPDVRVWTNVGDAHIGFFGSREAVAMAKAEILEDADARTLVVANADDPLVMAHVARHRGRLVTFGTAPAASVRATDIVDRGIEGLRATVHTPIGGLTLDTALPGRGHMMNILAAVSVATNLGVDLADVERCVKAARPVRRRGQVTALAPGVRLVDDSYNASPAAVKVMLEAVASTPVTGRRVAVLGEMLELGDGALALHEECGRAAAAAGVSLLVAVGGPAAEGFASGARAAGLAGDQVLRFADAVGAAKALPRLVRAGDLILVKGSRGTRTDLIADAIAAEGQG